MKVTIPVSVGELIDKITILEIKGSLTNDNYIHKELEELKKIKSVLFESFSQYEIELKKVNKILWEIEDKIREKEKNKNFDDEFINLARSVYINNDKRSEIKKKINILSNSEYQEIKLFSHNY